MQSAASRVTVTVGDLRPELEKRARAAERSLAAEVRWALRQHLGTVERDAAGARTRARDESTVQR
jgi:hypothetical protein